jgi:thiol:disulfide interchange protein
MTRQRRRQKLSKKKKTPAIRWGVIVGVAALIGAVLLLKSYRSSTGLAVSQDEIEPTPLAVEMAVPIESTPSGAEAAALPAQPTPALLPEAQLNQLLAAEEPVFVFFHSNTCVQCVKMTQIVEQVYPDFSDSVALVDVNVYDERNQNLLQRADIRVIPTLIFVDREGQAQGHIGVMESQVLREQLQALSEDLSEE